MSSGSPHAPTGKALFLLLLALGVPSSGARAQETPSEAVQAARARVDSLLPILERLRERRDSAREAERARLLAESQFPLDTFSVGPLRVVSRPERRELATGVFREAWEGWAPFAAGSESALRSTLFAFRYSSERSSFLERERHLRWVSVGRGSRREAIVHAAWLKVGQALLGGLGEDIREWAGGQPVVSPDRLPWIAREVVSAPSQAARRCYRGDLAWCWEALGLADTIGAWERWYAPDERRLFLEKSGPRGGADGHRALWAGCVEQGRDDACGLLLEGMAPVIPLSGEARASFLLHVLRRGGEGALARLEAAPDGTLRERLLRASGEHPDTLMASWRREVLRAKPDAWAGLGWSPVLALVWVLVFAALATRSTRCRLG